MRLLIFIMSSINLKGAKTSALMERGRGGGGNCLGGGCGGGGEAGDMCRVDRGAEIS